MDDTEDHKKLSWRKVSVRSIPSLLSPVSARKEGDMYLFKDLRGLQVEINETAFLIWNLCDGKNTVAEIAELISGYFPVSRSSSESAVMVTLESLESMGVLEILEKEDCCSRVILNSHWIGRFGNRMHQHAYAAQYAKLHGASYWAISHWEGVHLFKAPGYDLVPDINLRADLVEASRSGGHAAIADVLANHRERTGWDFDWINPQNANEAWSVRPAVVFDDLCGYDSHIFRGLDPDFLLNDVFVFSEKIRSSKAFRKWQERQGTYDIAHLRRDDLVDKNNRSVSNSVVSVRSYHRAFEAAGIAPEKVLWVTDDKTGKWGAGKADMSFGWTYPEGSSYQEGPVFDWLEDFLKIYFARTVFRSNSSFSFWACFLSQQRERPARVFAPRLDKSVPHWSDDAPDDGTDFNFEESNLPHWMSLKGRPAPDILFGDDPAPQRAVVNLEDLPSRPPFNGDTLVQQEITKLCDALNIECIVETGTLYGDTTSFMANLDSQRPIYTVELDDENYAISRAKLGEIKNITQWKGSSDRVLEQRLPGIGTEISGGALFYLDAHWNDDWPLHGELRAIAKSFYNRACIVIDDFEVPGRSYQFDSYKGLPNNWEFVKEEVARCYPQNGFLDYYLDHKPSIDHAVGKIYLFPRSWLDNWGLQEADFCLVDDVTGLRYSVL